MKGGFSISARFWTQGSILKYKNMDRMCDIRSISKKLGNLQVILEFLSRYISFVTLSSVRYLETIGNNHDFYKECPHIANVP